MGSASAMDKSSPYQGVCNKTALNRGMPLQDR
jgi:hypothetical protein